LFYKIVDMFKFLAECNCLPNIGMGININFDLVARLRSIVWNGGEREVAHYRRDDYRVNWDHYARVLEAKHQQNITN
jgi:hypothetical protein